MKTSINTPFVFSFLFLFLGKKTSATSLQSESINDNHINRILGNKNVFKPKKKDISGTEQCIDELNWRDSDSNCFKPHKGPGCDNKYCQDLICACDPACCEPGNNWDAKCAGVDESLECGARCDCLCIHTIPGQETPNPTRRPTPLPTRPPRVTRIPRPPNRIPGQDITSKPTRRPTNTKPPTPKPTRRPTPLPTKKPKGGTIPGTEVCIPGDDWRDSDSNCFKPSRTRRGCDNKYCQDLICACDSDCCPESGKPWDEKCAGVDESLECGARCDCLCIHQQKPSPPIGGTETTKPTRQKRPTNSPVSPPTDRPTRAPRSRRPTTSPVTPEPTSEPTPGPTLEPTPLPTPSPTEQTPLPTPPPTEQTPLPTPSPTEQTPLPTPPPTEQTLSPTPSPTFEATIPGNQVCIPEEDWRLSDSNCFKPSKTRSGCDNQYCQDLICACDKNCCPESGKPWDELCAGVDETLECGARCDCLCIHQN